MDKKRNFKSANVLRRPPDKQDEIVEHFRKRIIEGNLKIGDCLTSRMDIKKHFGVSYLTVQRAFDRLNACGFVDSIKSKGTFVSSRQPHLRRFALVLPGVKKLTGEKNRYYEALKTAASLLSTDERTVEIYENVETHPASEGYSKLFHDVENKSVAGMIFPSYPWHLKRDPLISADIPMELDIFGTGHEDGTAPFLDGMPYFLDKAIKKLASVGSSRIACIAPRGNYAAELANILRTELAAKGLVFDRKWLQAGNIGFPEWNCCLVRLLLDGGADTAPDGLIILDDNIAWDVFGEIEDMGIWVPDSLRIVSHCNFPFDDRPPFPVDFMGYDIVKLLSNCLDRLQEDRTAQLSPSRKKKATKRIQLENLLIMQTISKCGDNDKCR